jgi:hypothetical protein
VARHISLHEVHMVAKNTLRRTLFASSAVLVAACQDSPIPSGPTPGEPSLSRAQAAQQAASAFDRASAEVLALPGTVFADFDELNGRLLFGVENAAAIRGVETALGRLGLARSTYAVQVTQPVVFAKTLQQEFDPTLGGIQINFPGFLCTMGFNVDHAGERSFITNSHCTTTQGGVEGTEYWQPLSSVNPEVIATEVEDPTYFTRQQNSVCPAGKRCRYSDASRAAYKAGTASDQGLIATTTAANNGSLEVAGTFTVTSQENSKTNFAVGTVVNKVGRTTGWSRGTVSNTCVHTNVSGSRITQLCQTFVSAGVGSGDSGSPVFIETSNGVQLVGILWGGSGSTTFVFSPLANVIREIGSINAVR